MEKYFCNKNCVFLLFIIVINLSYSLTLKTENGKFFSKNESKALSNFGKNDSKEKSNNDSDTLSPDKSVIHEDLSQNSVLRKNNPKKNESFIELGTTINYVDKKYGMSFIQSKIDQSDLNVNGNYLMLLDTRETHRFTRLIWAIIIVVIMSLACYFIVKYSVDWVKLF